jgi:hypothetical protein
MDFKAAATKEERLEATRHLVKAFGQKKGQRSDLCCSVADPDPGSGAFMIRYPGWIKNRIRIRVPGPG